MNPLSTLFKRQYRLSGQKNSRSNCPIFKPYFMPPSAFESLEVEDCIDFYDTREENSTPVTAIIHKDGHTLASNDVGDVLILDDSFKELIKFNAHLSAIFDIKMRPNFRDQFMTASGDQSVALWDMDRLSLDSNSNSNLFSICPAHNGSVKCISFCSPHVFMSCGRDGAIKLWDMRTSNASKSGPVLLIPNAHLHNLPSVKSQMRSTRLRRKSPSAWLHENIFYHPSNVVTCVEFHPTNNNYCYSSGIGDNSIKVWDIRRCCRQFQCAIESTPTKIHTTKNISPSNNHGYSDLMLKHSSQGVRLYASSTNGNIYGFASSSFDPDIVFTGRLSDSQTKISSFGDDYVLSGSSNDRVYLWDGNFEKNLQCKYNEEDCFVENRLPIFELDDLLRNRDDIPMVFGDFLSQSIYTCTGITLLIKWTFYGRSKKNIPDSACVPGSVPKCTKFSLPKYCDKYTKTVRIDLKRASKFENIACKRQSMPLQSITNWMQSGTTKRFKKNETNCDEKTTPTNTNGNDDNDVDENVENRLAIVSKSTSHKEKVKNHSIKRRNSRRNLFDNNRKIQEFFTPA